MHGFRSTTAGGGIPAPATTTRPTTTPRGGAAGPRPSTTPELGSHVAAACLAVLLSLPAPLFVPPAAEAASATLASPVRQQARNAEAALRRSVPVSNAALAECQSALEDVQCEWKCGDDARLAGDGRRCASGSSAPLSSPPAISPSPASHSAPTTPLSPPQTR